MKSVSGKAFAKERHGWTLARVNGSHHVYIKPGHPARLSLPVHGNQDLKTGLLKHFMKMAGISESELQRWRPVWGDEKAGGDEHR